nr:L,D-transpeptidase [Lusitaniella coriacea]
MSILTVAIQPDIILLVAKMLHRLSKTVQSILMGSSAVFLLLGGGDAIASSPFSRELPPLGEATQFLPDVEETRLILRLRDRRVYYYIGDEILFSYPVAIGRKGWETPTGQFSILQKIPHPTWQHPFTQEIVPPGPENPLGVRWIGFWTDGQNYIGFHGTPNEELIGQAVSHGCVRMRNTDITALFEKVKLGTPVIVEP